MSYIGNILVLDIHVYTKDRKYKTALIDIVLGINYRETTKKNTLDKSLGGHLCSTGFTTFAPTDADSRVAGGQFSEGFICRYLSDVYDIRYSD